MENELRYQAGFGNQHASEALPGALPVGRNSPQRCPYGLYAEQLTGTAFTAPRAENRRCWLYRIRPATVHGAFESLNVGRLSSEFGRPPAPPNRLRWNPPAVPGRPADFVEGLTSWAGNAQPDVRGGAAILYYLANRSMQGRYFYDADAELLLLPQQGRLLIESELGRLTLAPEEIGLIPRGVRFRVELLDGSARGYACENFGAPFRLPELGPIGANGLAQARDFLTPVAWYEDREGDFELVAKFAGQLWRAQIDHSPLDVVAWHGNYAPCKYDLRRFNTLGSISFDHPDPSIFSVLHAVSDTPGVNAIDFVIFPPRILAMRDTFRLPWFHRNVASEFMGLIRGQYDARAEGFLPGGASLHNCMSGHGPDADSFRRASNADLSQPDVLVDTLAFMIETRTPLHPTEQALRSPALQRDYDRCWAALEKHFDPRAPGSQEEP